MPTLLIVRDAEFLRELWIELGGLLDNMLHHSATRAAFDECPEARQFFRRSDGINFNPAIAKIPHITRNMQALGFILRKITEANTLHDSGNQIAASDMIRGH